MAAQSQLMGHAIVPLNLAIEIIKQRTIQDLHANYSPFLHTQILSISQPYKQDEFHSGDK